MDLIFGHYHQIEDNNQVITLYKKPTHGYVLYILKAPTTLHILKWFYLVKHYDTAVFAEKILAVSYIIVNLKRTFVN